MGTNTICAARDLRVTSTTETEQSMPATSRPRAADAGNVVDIQSVAPQYVHVQLRPRTQAFARCVGALEATIRRHEAVDVDIAGLARDSHHILITLAINAGPRHQVPKFSAAAVAAFEFTSDLFDKMFDFLPQYAAAPTAEERALAESLPHLVAHTRDAGTLASVTAS